VSLIGDISVRGEHKSVGLVTVFKKSVMEKSSEGGFSGI